MSQGRIKKILADRDKAVAKNDREKEIEYLESVVVDVVDNPTVANLKEYAKKENIAIDVNDFNRMELLRTIAVHVFNNKSAA